MAILGGIRRCCKPLYRIRFQTPVASGGKLPRPASNERVSGSIPLVGSTFPQQDGTAERWVGTACRELLDHVIVLNEDHLRSLLRDYGPYYNADRVHTQLRDAPAGRPTETRPSPDAKVVGLPRVGGLHHRYVWREAV